MKVRIVLGVVALLVGGFFVFNSYIYNEKQAVVAADYKDATYVIDGARVRLGGQVTYFGNELRTDLTGDGREDVAFIVTYQPGGSGTFYYVVAAIATDAGYVGTDGYLLGDRIAPQSTVLSQNPRHVGVVMVTYADRALGEPMSTPPSVGKSVYLKVDADALQWGIVEPDFEGESR